MSEYRNPVPIEWAVDSQLHTLNGCFSSPLKVVKNIDSHCIDCSGLLRLRWDIYSQYKRPERVLSAINDKMRELNYNLVQGNHKEYVFKVFDSTTELYQDNVAVSILIYWLHAEDSMLNLVDVHKVLMVDKYGHISPAIKNETYYISSK